MYAKKKKYKVEIDFDGKWRIKIADKIRHDQREGDWVESWKDYKQGAENDANGAKEAVEAHLSALRQIKRHEEENANYEITI